ncbi:DUF4304 domain-containing protein [Sphingomonas sp. ASY06-1R]|jgi:hypothetical protein|uniref:DUF4304 domain-containing protein n=1 Tax=Sphingomonas sp. ASY06-1R TaxID=3445771 RepID=UPI003FA2349F
MNRKLFLKLLGEHLYPILRAEGFVGTGATLRRIDGPVIHVFNVQGARSGGEFYLNLGAHLSFLPSAGGGAIDPQEIDEPSCVFRDRLDPPPGPEFGWSYCASPEEAAESVAFIVSEWESVGRAFFARYACYPQSFEALIRKEDPDQVHPSAARTLARIAIELGRPVRASDFLEAALRRVPERATLLKADLVAMADAIQSRPGR